MVSSQYTLLSPNDFSDYELLDSGLGAKLERFGGYLCVRPDPRILWKPSLPESEWNKADASFQRTDPTSGDWHVKRKPPANWHLSYRDIRFQLKPTSFKHVGIFPEQAANWAWIQKNLAQKKNAKVLNLFAYTGGATMAAAASGAQVTHVDASKSIITWARENARDAKLGESPIRWIEDDALKFAQREAKRESFYDGIIMDPPRFGRGAKNEVWKIEDSLASLVESTVNILTRDPQFFLLNAYTADLSPYVLKQVVEDYLKPKRGHIEFGELVVKESGPLNRVLPSGIFVRWSATEK